MLQLFNNFWLGVFFLFFFLQHWEKGIKHHHEYLKQYKEYITMDSEERVMLMRQGTEGEEAWVCSEHVMTHWREGASPSEPGLLSNTLWYKKSTDDGTSYLALIQITLRLATFVIPKEVIERNDW